jgi:hypothetical protein
MTDPNQTQVAGTFRVNGADVAYKCDFAAFDFDGDGDLDGSGNAVDLPVAIRIWTDHEASADFQQFLCALVETKPSTDNLGKGEVYFRPFAVDSTAFQNAQIYVLYDRTDTTHRRNEAYVSGQLHPFYRIQDGRARVDVQTMSDASVEKTVRAAYEFVENPYGFESFQSATHHRVSGAGLLVTATTAFSAGSLNIDEVCVDLITLTLSEEACTGFNTQYTTLLDLPSGGESAFPAGFPETPTF